MTGTYSFSKKKEFRREPAANTAEVAGIPKCR